MRISDYIRVLTKNFISWLRDNTLYIAIIAVFSTIPLGWYEKGASIANGDTSNLIALEKHLLSINSSWRSDINTGGPEVELMYHTPFSILYLPFYKLGVSSIFLEKLWTYFFTLFCCISMYILLGRFNKKTPKIINSAVAIFYLYNPLTVITPIFLSLPKAVVYMTTPFILFLLLSFLEEKNRIKALLIAIFIAISTISLSSGFVNIAELAPVIIIPLIFILFKFIKYKNEFYKIPYLFIILIMSFLLNFWWINSSFFSMYQTKGERVDSIANFSTTKPKTMDIIRLLGFWAFRATFDGYPYFPYANQYYKNPLLLLTYLIPLAVLSTLILIVIEGNKISAEIKNKAGLAIIIYTVGVFLSKGASPPFGNWYTYIFNNITFFKIFREPYSKFSLITLIGTCLVISTLFYFIYTYLDKKLPKSEYFISIVMILYIRFIAFPIFDGSIASKYTYGAMKEAYAIVPTYWHDLVNYTKDLQTDNRILILPKPSYSRKGFIWERGYSGMPADLLLNKTTTWYMEYPIYKGDIVVNELYDSIERYLYTKEDTQLIKAFNIIRLLNIEYILQLNDTDYLSLKNYDPWQTDNMNNIVDKRLANLIDEKEAFGELSIEYLGAIKYVMGGENIIRKPDSPKANDYIQEYGGRPALVLSKIDSQFVNNKIYLPDKIIKDNKKIQDSKNLYNIELIYNNTMFVDPSINIDEYTNADVNYTKISESKYFVNVISKRSKGEIPIVFSETYDDGWKLYTKCNYLFCLYQIPSQHFIANFYANGWLINSDEMPEKFYIVHNSQARLKVGFLVSVVTFFIAIIFSIKKYSQLILSKSYVKK